MGWYFILGMTSLQHPWWSEDHLDCPLGLSACCRSLWSLWAVASEGSLGWAGELLEGISVGQSRKGVLWVGLSSHGYDLIGIPGGLKIILIVPWGYQPVADHSGLCGQWLLKGSLGWAGELLEGISVGQSRKGVLWVGLSSHGYDLIGIPGGLKIILDCLLGAISLLQITLVSVGSGF